jgi:predicted dehydrogenase
LKENVIKLAVIGCGRWGPNHVRTFNLLPESKVDALADPDAGRLDYVRAMYPGLRCERDYRLILDDPAIDAVVVATPLSTHYEIVRESLLAGKHVLCEKPLCSKSEQGEELVALARANGVHLMVGHVFLFNPGVLKLKELVDAGELGQLRYLSASRTNLGPIRSDTNAAYDLCSHDISIFNWLLGSNPEAVTATGASFVQSGIEDVVFVSMKYPDNVLASIHASWLDPKKVRQITIVGSRQMATWDDLQATAPIAIYDKGVNTVQDYGDFGEYLRLSMWEGDVRLPKVHFGEPLKIQAEEFLKSLQNGYSERSDGTFGLNVVKVLEALTISMRQGGSPTRVSS